VQTDQRWARVAAGCAGRQAAAAVSCSAKAAHIARVYKGSVIGYRKERPGRCGLVWFVRPARSILVHADVARTGFVRKTKCNSSSHAARRNKMLMCGISFARRQSVCASSSASRNRKGEIKDKVAGQNVKMIQ
jgi:hypothetical protein